nr:hypothetical protein TorRG33x02_127770 [Ipomoea trifida]
MIDLDLRLWRFVNRIEQPPLRNRQFASIMDFSFPEYQNGAMDSEVTTMAKMFRRHLNMFSTRFTEIRLALHPIPDKLNALTSSLIAKRRTILEHKDGAGDSIETFTTRTSISAGDTPDFANSFSNVSKKHSSISSIPSTRVAQFSRPSTMFRGAYVSSPMPEFTTARNRNLC